MTEDLQLTRSFEIVEEVGELMLERTNTNWGRISALSQELQAIADARREAALKAVVVPSIVAMPKKVRELQIDDVVIFGTAEEPIRRTVASRRGSGTEYLIQFDEDEEPTELTMGPDEILMVEP